MSHDHAPEDRGASHSKRAIQCAVLRGCVGFCFVDHARVGLLAGLFLAASAASGITAPVGFVPYAADLPDFTLDRIAPAQAPGGSLNLSSLAGRVVVVHFFATWCEPCRAELPALARFADRFSARPLTVVVVDVGEIDERVRRFLAEVPVPFPVLMDRDRAVTKAWGVSALPGSVILDSHLRTRLLVEGEVDWDGQQADAAVSALLDEPELKTTDKTKQTGGRLQ